MANTGILLSESLIVYDETISVVLQKSFLFYLYSIATVGCNKLLVIVIMMVMIMVIMVMITVMILSLIIMRGVWRP